MKQFIYLDNDIVNSIIAQKEKGLVKDIKVEASETSSKVKQETKNIEGNINVNGNILGLAKAESKLMLGAIVGNNNSISNTTQQLIEKTMHDAAFDMAYECLTLEKAEFGNTNDIEHGKYIELTRVFDFVDLQYLEGLFSKDGLIDYIKETTSNSIRAEFNKKLAEMSSQQAKTVKQTLIQEQKKKIEESNREFDSIGNTIGAFRKMAPYSRMLISNDGYLIPLDEKYFRVNPTSVGFMYGGDITCIGMITNIIGKDTNPEDDKNIFANLQFVINEALRSILPTKEENIYVVHPIAVYYNN